MLASITTPKHTLYTIVHLSSQSVRAYQWYTGNAVSRPTHPLVLKQHIPPCPLQFAWFCSPQTGEQTRSRAMKSIQPNSWPKSTSTTNRISTHHRKQESRQRDPPKAAPSSLPHRRHSDASYGLDRATVFASIPDNRYLVLAEKAEFTIRKIHLALRLSRVAEQ